MRLLRLLGLSGFSSPTLERRYWAEKNSLCSKADDRFHLFAAAMWVGGTQLWNKLQSRPEVLLTGWLGAALYLSLYLALKRAPEFYVRHRVLLIAAARLAALFLKETDLELLPPGALLHAPPARVMATLVFASNVIPPWLLGMSLPLPMGVMVGLQGLLAAQVALFYAPSQCRADLMLAPEMAGVFTALSGAFTSWALMLVPTLPIDPGPAGAEQPSAEQHCWAVLVALHLFLGLFLSTFAAYICDRRSRARFLARAAWGAASGQEPPAAVVERLGVSPQELVEAATFDQLGAWAKCAALAPFLAALAWLEVLLAGRRWVPTG